MARCLEPVRLAPPKAAQLFSKMSVSDPALRAKVVSLHRFAIGCAENDLFSPATQRAFLRIQTDSECVPRLEEILRKQTVRVLEARLRTAGEDDAGCEKRLRTLNEAFGAGNFAPQAKVLLIRCMLLEAESVVVYLGYGEANNRT